MYVFPTVFLINRLTESFQQKYLLAHKLNVVSIKIKFIEVVTEDIFSFQVDELRL